MANKVLPAGSYNLLRVDGRFSAGRLLYSLAVTLGAGLIGVVFQLNAAQAYSSLRQPSFAPPPALFMPVWIVLYLLTGLALYRAVMRSGEPEGKMAVFYFGLQLFFNVLWPLFFFTLELRLAAFADILILLFYIILTAVRFFALDRAAGYLMLPYALWVTFAAALNLAVVILNG